MTTTSSSNAAAGARFEPEVPLVCCNRCIHVTPRGRCLRKTCNGGPRCWQHTRLMLGLKVGPSGVAGAGKGLRATRSFRRGDFVSPYYADVKTDDQLDEIYGEGDDALAPYALKVNSAARNGEPLVYDARRTDAGYARYANDCRPENRRSRQCRGNNAAFEPNGYLRALRDIRPGEEVFASYGASYWGDDPDSDAEDRRQLQSLPRVDFVDPRTPEGQQAVLEYTTNSIYDNHARRAPPRAHTPARSRKRNQSRRRSRGRVNSCAAQARTWNVRTQEFLRAQLQPPSQNRG